MFMVDADARNFTVTHIKSGILYNSVSQESIRKSCKESFEGISQMILQSVYTNNNKNSNNTPADSDSVVQFTDAAVNAINKIAHQNLHHQHLYRCGKF